MQHPKTWCAPFRASEAHSDDAHLWWLHGRAGSTCFSPRLPCRGLTRPRTPHAPTTSAGWVLCRAAMQCLPRHLTLWLPFLSFLFALSFSGLLSNKSLSLLSWLVVALSFFFSHPAATSPGASIGLSIRSPTVHDPINN